MDTVHRESVRALVVVGASTGGPKALSDLFVHLPALGGVACCIVQHMPAGFTANLAKRLNDTTAWTVSEGRDGDILKPGSVYVAPGGLHMRVSVERNHLCLSVRKEEPVRGHQPSVDVLFHSTACVPPHIPLVGVLLTGMGRDGAEGLSYIRKRGGFTVAESQESAVIYGMPKAAVENGAAMVVEPVWKIPDVLEKHLRR
ncbi:CheB methylesterase domain-containing protein [Alicyclobacillus dauci]|uniref:protein-glutamate methylesterase n=1 Tax=Alicyclobacillus dauci TaxID=1475485 RepID=A0ABY6YXV5_9BACL|nr:CheB methylesterase domain-containing protein [Alicyclobacillus dauci]WAH35386.1 CheB methylesterase domain-containing protein [Alicyclobacillus dauci]